jgi:hypothetical protein
MIFAAVVLIALFAIVLVAKLGTSSLVLRRDVFFIAWLIQGVVYLVLSPMIVVMGEGVSIQNGYLVLIVYSVMLFLVPAILVYRGARRVTTAQGPVEDCYAITYRRAAVATACLMAYQLLYLFVLLRTDSLFRRIGTYEAAQQRASLDPISLLIMRSFELSFMPSLMYLAFIQFALRSQREEVSRARKLMRIPLVSWSSLYVVFGLLNSRSALAFGAVLIGGIVLFYRGRSLPKKTWRLVIVGNVLAIYGMLVVVNIRTSGLDAPLTQILDPLAPLDRHSNDLEHEWVGRLDGIDLMERIGEEAGTTGYAGGQAWSIPAFLSIAQYVIPSAAVDYKIQARTTAKTYLLEKYTHLDPGDYPSCCLTDVYGNFGVWSFPFAGALVGWLFAMAGRLVQFGNRSSIVLLGMFLTAHLIFFEQEFINLLLGWTRLIPGALIFLVLLPLRPGSSTENVQRPATS